jgi:hypothetical protein
MLVFEVFVCEVLLFVGSSTKNIFRFSHCSGVLAKSSNVALALTFSSSSIILYLSIELVEEDEGCCCEVEV